MSETRMTDFVYLTREAFEDVVRTIGPDGDGSRSLILQTDAALRAALAAKDAEIERLKGALNVAAKRMKKEKCTGRCECAFCRDARFVEKGSTR